MHVCLSYSVTFLEVSFSTTFISSICLPFHLQSSISAISLSLSISLCLSPLFSNVCVEAWVGQSLKRCQISGKQGVCLFCCVTSFRGGRAPKPLPPLSHRGRLRSEKPRYVNHYGFQHLGIHLSIKRKRSLHPQRSQLNGSNSCC